MTHPDKDNQAERAAPCPWCGEIPDINNDASFRLTDGVKYGALQCCVTGPEVRTDYKDVDHWRAAAVAAWNDRSAAPPALDAEGLPEPWRSDGYAPLYTAEQVRQAQRDAYEAGYQSQMARIQHLTHERDLALRAASQEIFDAVVHNAPLS